VIKRPDAFFGNQPFISKVKFRGAYRDYFTIRWLVLYAYVLIVFFATPYLPSLIKQASSMWSSGSLSTFVLGVEIFLGFILIALCIGVFFYKRQKFFRFVIILGGVIIVACLFYRRVPNPYELTHLPEYAIMSVLILHAIKELEGKRREKVSEKRVYFQSAVITGILGSVDELFQGVLPMRYFAWYDIFLNMLGGILGLTIFWGITREQ
jgi:hypothetical protein